jgi:glycosyltransferase involved in cell wall biosynthesis
VAALVSIVISNFNYARYLPDAVESALNQTYPRVEVIVADDGSTDDSLAVLRRYPEVEVIRKENGGHASALNAGFRAAKGDIVFFLDADDVLYADAAQVVAQAHEPRIASHQFRLDVVDEDLRKSNELIPARPPDSGDLRRRTLRRGPGSRVCPPCSGLAWSRGFLSSAMPVPGSHVEREPSRSSPTLPLCTATFTRTNVCWARTAAT